MGKIKEVIIDLSGDDTDFTRKGRSMVIRNADMANDVKECDFELCKMFLGYNLNFICVNGFIKIDKDTILVEGDKVDWISKFEMNNVSS